MASKKTASPKKAPAPEIDRSKFSQMPGPLPEGCSGDPEKDARGDVVAMLRDGALEVGYERWDEDFVKKLPPKERRAYREASEAAYSGTRERLAWLGAVMKAAAKKAPGRARLAEIAGSNETHPQARRQAAVALFAVKPSHAELLAVRTMFSLPAEESQARREGAKAILLQDRARAFEELAPRLPDEAVIYALIELAPEVDERWLEALLPFVHRKDHDAQYSTMMALARFPHDPRMVDAVLLHLEKPAAEITFFADQVLDLLVRSGEPRVVPYLAQALDHSPQWDRVIDGLRKAADPVAVHALRRFLGKHEKTDRNWPGIAAAEAAIAALEKLGPVPPEPVEAPKKPKKRARRKVRKAPKVVVSPLGSLEEQRADLVELLASAKLEEHADALIIHGIELISRRSDEDSLPVGRSRLGGRPDLPKGMPWPKSGENYLSFVAQIDLAEIGDSGGVLPSSGVLSFFVLDEGEDEYLEEAKVFHFEQALVRAEVPANFDRRPAEAELREPFLACSLEPRPILTLPSASHWRVRKALDEAELRRYRELSVSMGERNVLLGTRDRSYDETPEGERLLLQLTSDDQAMMEWGDVDDLSFLIPEEALRARDWSQVHPHSGD